MTVRLVALAEVTVAMVAPKNTISLEAVELKLLPVIVTDVPTAPLAGLNELITGATGVARAWMIEKTIKKLHRKSFLQNCRVKVLII